MYFRLLLLNESTWLRKKNPKFQNLKLRSVERLMEIGMKIKIHSIIDFEMKQYQ
mgnify:CR=1 FL=1